jgi:hypothetical protein
MDISSLTIGQAREIAAMISGAQQSSAPATIPGNLRKVIVRSRDAGVIYGKLVSYTSDGALVHLQDARQMWSWTAKEGGTLIDCATFGVKAGKLSTSTAAATVIGACAIIDCTDAAAATLEGAKWA